MWDTCDGYILGEEDDAQDGVCSPNVDDGQCEAVLAAGAQPKRDKARVCLGRKRRIVQVTQWSASARANMIRALRERVT